MIDMQCIFFCNTVPLQMDVFMWFPNVTGKLWILNTNMQIKIELLAISKYSLCVYKTY